MREKSFLRAWAAGNRKKGMNSRLRPEKKKGSSLERKKGAPIPNDQWKIEPLGASGGLARRETPRGFWQQKKERGCGFVVPKRDWRFIRSGGAKGLQRLGEVEGMGWKDREFATTKNPRRAASDPLTESAETCEWRQGEETTATRFARACITQKREEERYNQSMRCRQRLGRRRKSRRILLKEGEQRLAEGGGRRGGLPSPMRRRVLLRRKGRQ